MPARTAEERQALVLEQPGVVRLMTVPIPDIPPIYALVKTTAVAIHPIDPATVDYYGANGTIVGSQFAGIVDVVGSDVELDIKPGDRVFGLTHGNKTDSMDVITRLFKGDTPTTALSSEVGAFTDHVLAHGDLMMKIPPQMSDNDACTLPSSITVAGMALYRFLGLQRPHEPYERPLQLLISGGNTASGAVAIQLATLSGLCVIATCSPKNFDYVKSLGAQACYDYREPDVARHIRRDYPMIQLAYETTMEDDAWVLTQDAFSLSGGRAVGNCVFTSFLRPDVTYQHVPSYICFGERFSMGPVESPSIPEAYEWSKEWWRYATKLVWDGKIKPRRNNVREGGLEAAIEGIDQLRKKNHLDHRLVYRV